MRVANDAVSSTSERLAPDVPLAGPAVAVLHVLRALNPHEAQVLANRLTDVALELTKGERCGDAYRLWLSVTLVGDDV